MGNLKLPKSVSFHNKTSTSPESALQRHAPAADVSGTLGKDSPIEHLPPALDGPRFFPTEGGIAQETAIPPALSLRPTGEMKTPRVDQPGSSSGPLTHGQDGPAVSSPTPSDAGTVPVPPEFVSLFAEVERRVAGVNDETLMGYQTLGATQPYVLGITSAVAGEGKTTVAIHLALSTARSTFKRVGLIDLSLDRDVMCERLGIASTGEGIIGNLEGAGQTVRTLRLPGYDNLVVIPAGRAPANAAKLAHSPRVAELITAARQSFDIVIVDLPAVSRGHVLPLTQHIDGILLVARAAVTPKDVVSQAMDHLGRKKVLGVTLNRVQDDSPKWLSRLLRR